MPLANITVRIPDALRDIIEAAAKNTNSSIADEIRKALSTYYDVKDDHQVTFADLEARFAAHVSQMHTGQVVNVIEKEEATPEKPEPEEDAEAIAKERTHEFNKLACLRQLGKMLNEGQQPTPSEIGKDIGLSPLVVGRALTSLDIRATNTRINNISGRYYLKALRPAVEELLLKMNGGGN